MDEDLKYDLKIDGLTVYMNWKGNAIKNVAKYIRTKYDIERGSIVEQTAKLFKCNIVKDNSSTTYSLTFDSERDMMYFILHT